MLARIREEFNVPVLTDVHSPGEALRAGEVVDVVQIPAFLCRQTDLAIACGQTRKPVCIKKGQFMAPEDMSSIASKVEEGGSGRVILVERGTAFGYHNLVVDMRALPIMRETGCPVVFDCTHSIQRPGGLGDRSGGDSRFIETLARAAAGAGVDGVFIETHPDCANALATPPPCCRSIVWKGSENLIEIDSVVKQSGNRGIGEHLKRLLRFFTSFMLFPAPA